ncbi:hypothetical protein [Dyella tabacisoli]|uniref:Uncharacterized protein n=1 Tax=Dyella tabacisoli TaxID=2282381 RepID=A0A369ULK4_9GAMM|nr:hypothetical protein [Dyella tabacisoli]RDD80480.1 hypothetical protein DVJ77_16430 [Dyella tabacisoli]
MQRLLTAALVLLLALGALHWWQHRSLTQTPGVLAPNIPEQVNLDDGTKLQRGDVTLLTRAHMELTARLLSREDYSFDAGATLAPMDFALGWGRMSDSEVLAKISISQSNRFYYWHVDDFPIPRREIETSSANMHLIPADENVRRSLEHMRPGQLVHLQGFLVDASRPDGWQWHTSMTRDDTGNGACELFYVEAAESSAR